MKKSYKKLILFDIILIIILTLNSFILNILGNYYYMDIFLLLLLIIFKLFFGFEKDRHRYIKDIFANILIILLISFIIYYIFGIFIGFYRTTNYLTIFGFKTFIIPYILMIIMREYLRCQMLNKTENSKILTIATFIVFVLLELSPSYATTNTSSIYGKFMFAALTVLPVVSNNIVCTYIAKKVGYKVNIFWLLIANLYTVFLPIAPNDGLYIQSLIQFLFPYVLMYNTYSFFKKRENNVPISYVKKRIYIEIPILAIIVFGLAYFVSGFFRYYAVAVATGSMYPNIKVGDVVIIDQHKDYKTLEVGDVIAYKYNNIVVVHRLCDIVVVDKDYYFYTKGDNNQMVDDYEVRNENVVGIVRYVVKYIAFPTVWFNE